MIELAQFLDFMDHCNIYRYPSSFWITKLKHVRDMICTYKATYRYEETYDGQM